VKIPWHRSRIARLDARIAEATQAAERAAQDVRESRERFEAVQQDVVRPLREVAERNRFSDIIRATLTVNGGHGNAHKSA